MSSAIPPDAVYHLPDLLKMMTLPARLRVVLYLRVSARGQGKKGNLRDQERHARRALAKLHVKVIAVYPDVCSGKTDLIDRERFLVAVAHAKRENAILVAPDVSRFLRSAAYTSDTNPNAVPTDEEWRAFLALTDGVVKATLLHPSATPAEIRGWQTARGIRTKRRPRCTPGELRNRRYAAFVEVLDRHQDGESVRQIARAVNVPKSNVARWVKSPRAMEILGAGRGVPFF